MNNTFSTLLLTSTLSLWTISSDVHAAKERVSEEVNVVVKNVIVEGKKVDIVTSLPRNSIALKWAKCYKIIQQWEQIIYEIPASKLPGTSDFWVIDEHNMQRFEDTKESISCPKV